MIVSEIIHEDFINYKKPSLFIGFPSCTWKCEKECGIEVCQNKKLQTGSVFIDDTKIISYFINNPITEAVVCGGLEPFDSWEELQHFLYLFRKCCNADIIIYTGYYEYEIQDKISWLKNNISNVVVKFGRYVPNQAPHYDEVLGVKLASDNQYAVQIS